MHRLRACVLLLLLGGCFWTEALRPLASASSDWYEVGPLRKPLEEITRAAHHYLTRSGYVVYGFDPRLRWFETEWDTHLSTHWREGYRTKVEVVFQAVQDGTTLVRIRSYREVNEESKQPMVADKADWVGAAVHDKQAPLIPEPAIRLRQQLKMKFEGLRHE